MAVPSVDIQGRGVACGPAAAVPRKRSGRTIKGFGSRQWIMDPGLRVPHRKAEEEAETPGQTQPCPVMSLPTPLLSRAQ